MFTKRNAKRAGVGLLVAAGLVVLAYGLAAVGYALDGLDNAADIPGDA